MKLAVLLVALAACGACSDDRPSRAAQLPGTIYFVEDGDAPTLVRLTRGTRTELAQHVYPSPFALPDGRLVAIASRGDGSAEAEQLALVGLDGRVQRIGPAATQVRDPAVDRRGRWIVVAANLDGHSDLYRVELPSGRTTRLTNDKEGNYRPALLADSIVYVSSRDGDSEIYRDAERLTAFHRDDWEPTPSPDGSTIAFLSDRDGVARIYLMAADGTSLRRLTTHDAAEESAPTWSPDGKRIAYVAGNRVIVRDVTSGTEQVVTRDGNSELEPSFSPDGKWLAVARVRDDASDIWAVELATGEHSPIAKHARLPRWQ